MNPEPTPRVDIMRLIAVCIVAGLTWRVLELTASKPTLMKEQFWVVLCTALAVTAFGTMVNYFLGSSKGSSDRAARDAAQPMAGVDTGGGDVTLNTNTGADQKPAPVPANIRSPSNQTAASQPIAKFPS